MKSETFHPEPLNPLDLEKYAVSDIANEPTQEYPIEQEESTPGSKPTLEPEWKKEYGTPEFTLHEFERKLKHAEELVDYYKAKIIGFKELLQSAHPDDLIIQTIITEAIENFAFSLEKIKKPVELYAELQASTDPQEIEQKRLEIANFSFPTNVSLNTEALQVQFLAKTSHLKYEKRRLAGTDAHPQKLTPKERLQSLSTVLDLETELADIKAELQNRDKDIHTQTEPVISIPTNEELLALKTRIDDLPLAEEVAVDEPEEVPASSTVLPNTTTEATPLPNFVSQEKTNPILENKAGKTSYPDNLITLKKPGGLSNWFKKITAKFKRAA